jgi:hypothetical protein
VSLECTVERECRFTHALEIVLVVLLRIGQYNDER